MPAKQTGVFQEEEMVHCLNNKRFCELNSNLKTMINSIYGIVDDDEIITATMVEDRVKPDIMITCLGKTVGVSMKHGKAKVVHQENLKQFILWLRSMGISKDTQKTLVYFHYGDGTLDGTGKKRLESFDVLTTFADRIKKANTELNKNDAFIKQCMDRLLFKGTHDDYPEATYLYAGDAKYGVIASKTQILKHLSRRRYSHLQYPHIGPITMRPHARYAGKEIKNAQKRENIDFSWHDLMGELDIISNRYVG